jgi:hypothetical protein
MAGTLLMSEIFDANGQIIISNRTLKATDLSFQNVIETSSEWLGRIATLGCMPHR